MRNFINAECGIMTTSPLRGTPPIFLRKTRGELLLSLAPLFLLKFFKFQEESYTSQLSTLNCFGQALESPSGFSILNFNYFHIGGEVEETFANFA